MRKPKDPHVVEHKDRGCKAFPTCLTCPLPRCCMDAAPLDDNSLNPLSRAIEMVKLRKQNWLIREIAASYNVSERTVYRSLRRHKPAVFDAPHCHREAAAAAAAIQKGDIKR